MSRHDRFGVLRSGDLYLRSWELERESSHRNLGLSDSSSDQQEDQQIHQKHQHDLRHSSENTLCTNRNNILRDAGDDHSVQRLLRRKSLRRKPRPWRKPAVNRSLALRPGSVPAPSCSVPGYSSRFLGMDRSTGTTSFNQGYHNCWTPQPTPLLHGDAALALHVEPPTTVPIAGERDMFCLGSISEASTEDDFSPELMTG